MATIFWLTRDRSPHFMSIISMSFASKSLIFQLFVKIWPWNSSWTGFGRSAIVICPLESIIQDQVLEAQSIGVTACSLSAKNLSEVCENTPQLLFPKAEYVQNPVQNSKFQLLAIFWLVYFPDKIMRAERNMKWDCGRFSFLPSWVSPQSPAPNPSKLAHQAINRPFQGYRHHDARGAKLLGRARGHAYLSLLKSWWNS